MDLAITEGVNFFDTAELYSWCPLKKETWGITEKIIGNWLINLEQCRNKVRLSLHRKLEDLAMEVVSQ